MHISRGIDGSGLHIMADLAKTMRFGQDLWRVIKQTMRVTFSKLTFSDFARLVPVLISSPSPRE